jgi:hypothetical protein
LKLEEFESKMYQTDHGKIILAYLKLFNYQL